MTGNEKIRRERMVRQLAERGIVSRGVLDAMGTAREIRTRSEGSGG